MKDFNKITLIRYLTYSLFIGFPLGLFTLLMGPTKWVISLSEYYNWSEGTEEYMQKIVIVLFVVVSFILAYFINKGHQKYKSSKLKWGVFSFLALNFLFAVYMFSFHPERLIALSESVESTIISSNNSVEFVFGAYPNQEKLLKLKDENYTAVVTLMSEFVVPAEPKLIKEEKASAEHIGISLIHIPMLPWVSDNTKSLERIDSLAMNGKGKYYIHCYLGRDRVNVFKQMVENAGALTKDESKNRTRRQLEEIDKLERGSYFKLATDVFLTPYPTDEEFFGYVLGGQFNTIVSLLDSANPADKKWIDKEEKMVEQYGLTLISLPLNNNSSDDELKAAIDSVKKLPAPILIHDFRSDIPLVNRFVKIYQSK